MTLLSPTVILKSFEKIPEIASFQTPVTLFLDALAKSKLSIKEKRTQYALVWEILLYGDSKNLELIKPLLEVNFKDPGFFQRQCDLVCSWRRTCPRLPNTLMERSKKLGFLP